MIYRLGPWRSLEAVEYATLEWVDWFNHRQQQQPIGNIPPAEINDQYYAAADIINMVAWVRLGGLRQTRGGLLQL